MATKKKKTTTAVAKSDESAIAELQGSYTVEQGGYQRILLPRLSFKSQDVMEGKGKTKKVIIVAGTFFTERQTEELDDDGKKIWEKTEIGQEIEGVILYHRYQLSYYDEATEKYTSSPIFDSFDEVLPLFCDKKEIAKGTPAELKAGYEFIDKDGKTKSRLKDNRILYILYENEIFQLDLHGTSMYSFLKYARTVLPPSVLTSFNSEEKSKGDIDWNMMTFTPIKKLSGKAIQAVVEKHREIKEAITMEKGQLAAQDPEVVKAQKEADDGFKDL